MTSSDISLPETPRLRLRRFTPGDLADFLAYQGLPEVTRYMGTKPMDEPEAAAFLESQATARDGRKSCYHALAVEHLETGRVIGDVGFYLEDGPEQKGDLGFQFHPDFHRQGYAFEAARALIDHALSHWDLRRITAGCHTENAGCVRLLERLGMRREAHFLQSRMMDGVLHDEYHYAVLRDEWAAGSV